MPNYTDTEIAAAVKTIATTKVRPQKTALETVDVDSTFASTLELVSSSLLVDPDILFYLIYLVKEAANKALVSAITKVDLLLELANDVGGITCPVEHTALLADAANALIGLDTLIQDNVLSQSALSAYTQAVDGFVDKSIHPNVRRLTGQPSPNKYSIHRSAPEARKQLATMLQDLYALHLTLKAAVEQLPLILDDYQDLDLAEVAAKRTVRKIRQSTEQLREDFESATEVEKVEKARSAYLDLIAHRTMLGQVTETIDPMSARMAGLTTNNLRLSAYIGGSSTTTPAKVVGNVSAPFRLVTGVSDTLTIAMNGGADQLITIIPPAQKAIYGSADEPYDIHAAQKANLIGTQTEPFGIPAGPNNVFDIYVKGVGYRATIVPGAQPAAQVVANINAAPRLVGGAPNDFINDLNLASDVGGKIKLEHTVDGEVQILIGSTGAAFLNAILGFVTDQASDDVTDPNYLTTRGLLANNKIRFVVGVTPVEASLTTGFTRTAAQTASDIAGAAASITAAAYTIPSTPAGDAVKVWPTAAGAAARISVSATTAVHTAAMLELGIYNSTAQSVDLGGEELVRQITAGLTGGVPAIQYAVIAEGIDGIAVLAAGFYKLQVSAAGALAQAGDTLLIETGSNAMEYRLVAVAAVGPIVELTVDRPFQVVSPAAGSTNQVWKVKRDVLTITSSVSDLTTAVAIKGGTALAALGLSIATTYGTTTGARVRDTVTGKYASFVKAKVVEADLLTLAGPLYTTAHDVEETDGDFQLELSDPVPTNTINHLFSIYSSRQIAYVSYAALLETWLEAFEASDYYTDLSVLDRAFVPLVTQGNPSAGWVAAAISQATALLNMYKDLRDTVFAPFVVKKASRVDQILQMLKERGLDRALDLLLGGDLEAFFALDKNTASHGGNLLANMGTVVQNDLQMNSAEDNTDTILTESVTEVDAMLNYGDADNEMGSQLSDDFPDDYQ